MARRIIARSNTSIGTHKPGPQVTEYFMYRTKHEHCTSRTTQRGWPSRTFIEGRFSATLASRHRQEIPARWMVASSGWARIASPSRASESETTTSRAHLPRAHIMHRPACRARAEHIKLASEQHDKDKRTTGTTGTARTTGTTVTKMSASVSGAMMNLSAPQAPGTVSPVRDKEVTRARQAQTRATLRDPPFARHQLQKQLEQGQHQNRVPLDTAQEGEQQRQTLVAHCVHAASTGGDTTQKPQPCMHRWRRCNLGHQAQCKADSTMEISRRYQTCFHSTNFMAKNTMRRCMQTTKYPTTT